MAAPRILIASYLEPRFVARIRSSVDCQVLYAPELLPRPRYRNDHVGSPPVLDRAGERRWREHLAAAEISFDFDWWAPAQLSANAPRLRWIQATSVGIGEFVRRHGLDAGGWVMTTAAGTHAAPLAEFAVAGALYFIKDLGRMLTEQVARRWERRVGDQFAGRRATVVGLGSIGRRVAGVYTALGASVTGVGRRGRGYDLPTGTPVVTTDDLDMILPRTDILVLCCPLTDSTRNLIDAGRVARLPQGAIVVNVARGEVVDEDALVAALASGRLSGAALDVFRHEPLPAGSALWDLPNVLISPHSASNAADENAILTDLFIDNLRRYVDGRPLRNRYRPEEGY